MKYIHRATVDSLKEIGGDSFVAELVGLFLTQFERTAGEFGGWISARKFPELAALMHQMKSSAGNLGAMDLSRAAAEMESLAVAEDETGLRQRLPAFERIFSETCADLKTLA